MKSILLALSVFAITIPVFAQPHAVIQPIDPIGGINGGAPMAGNLGIPLNLMPAMMPALMPTFLDANSDNKAMIVTKFGAFIITDGLLVKFDAKTLKPLGTFRLLAAPTPQDMGNYMLPLKGPKGEVANAPVPGVAMPAAPAAQVFDWDKYSKDNQRFTTKPVMIVDDADLIIIIYDQFTRIGMDKLDILAATDIIANKNADGTAAEVNFFGEVPGIKLCDNILYINRGGIIMSVSPANGKVLGQVKFPTELMTNQMGMMNAITLNDKFDIKTINFNK